MNGGSRRLWLVARREWNQRVRSRAFRISTVISILLVVAIVVVPQIYGGGAKPARTVGLVGTTSPQLPVLLHGAGNQLGVSVKTRRFADETAGRAALSSGDVSVLLVDGRELVWKAEPDDQLQAIVTSAVQVLDRRRAIAEIGLTPEQAARLLRPPDLPSRSLEPVTQKRTARIAMATIGMILLFMAIAFYGGFVVTGVVEEKSSRVVEVLLSRLRPTELLGGKVIGIGLVGLAQFTLVAGSALVALSLSGNTFVPEAAPSTVGWIVFWFVMGYAFYSVLYATAGSLVSRQEDAQSIQFPVTAVLLIGYIWAFTIVDAPNSPVALVGSLLPPTAPMVMTIRMGEGGVPAWQVVLSVAVMVATVYGLVQLAGRIYTGAVLRIGRRVRLRDAWRGAEA